MRIENTIRDVAVNNPSPVFAATIKANAKAFRALSADLYSDPITAIVREYASNCIDAHIEAGVTTPFMVRMPTAFAPDIQFIDGGGGMSYEFMTTRFLAFNDGSTKDDNPQVLGGFGLGCKVGFAYTDQFNVTTTHQGETCSFALFLNDEGIPSIQLLDRRPTDHPNGTTVTIPVKPGDHGAFQNAARKVLQYFDPLPTVVGLMGPPLEGPRYLYRGSDWGLRPDEGLIHVIMGGVRYPLEISYADRTGWDSKLIELLGVGLDLFLPIGTFMPSISRESVRNTPEGLATVAKMLERILAELPQAFANLYDTQPTLWDAYVAFYNDLERTWGSRRTLYTEAANWRGTKLETSGWQTEKRYTYWQMRQTGRRLNGPIRTSKSEFSHGVGVIYQPALLGNIIIHTRKDKAWQFSQFSRGTEGWHFDKGKHHLVFRDVEDVDALLADLGNPPDTNIFYYADFPEPVKAPRKPRPKRVNPLQGLSGFRLCAPTTGERPADSFWHDIVQFQNETPSTCFYSEMDLGKVRDMTDLLWVPANEVAFVNKPTAARLAKRGFRSMTEEADRRKAAFLKSRGEDLENLELLLRVHNHYVCLYAGQADAKPSSWWLKTESGKLFKFYRKFKHLLGDNRLNDCRLNLLKSGLWAPTRPAPFDLDLINQAPGLVSTYLETRVYDAKQVAIANILMKATKA